MSKSLYDTLGINSDASVDEIKKAYRKLAKQYHPDRNPDDKAAEEKFKEINAAYEVLGDPEKKAQYDQFGDNMFGGQNFHDFARSQGGGVNLDDILRDLFSGGRAGGGFHQGFGGQGFGGFSQGGFGGYNEPDLDITARINIDFDTAVLGGKKSVSVNGESFDIKIPAGIKSGEKLRVKGKGKSFQSQKGDLFLLVEVMDSAEYERDGDDLIKHIDIPLKVALFGGKVDVDTLYKSVSLKVPKNTKQNQKFRLKELGVLNRKTNTKGNLYLKSNIILPNIDDLDPSLAGMMEKMLPEA
jgi:curved DNA-binding protein